MAWIGSPLISGRSAFTLPSMIVMRLLVGIPRACTVACSHQPCKPILPVQFLLLKLNFISLSGMQDF